jgi:hypothetical protein
LLEVREKLKTDSFDEISGRSAIIMNNRNCVCLAKGDCIHEQHKSGEDGKLGKCFHGLGPLWLGDWLD